jgi:hypothetical protein
MSLGREVIIEIALFGGRWLIFQAKQFQAKQITNNLCCLRLRA